MIGVQGRRNLEALSEYYLHDPRLILIPIEALSPSGIDRDFAAFLHDRCGWSAAATELAGNGFRTYWERSSSLASRTHTWAPPRLRNIGVVRDPWSVRPYVQILNTCTWMLYESDFDPEISHAELVAYLLALGDHMAITGEVTRAAIHGAAYWLDRSDAECEAFVAAATRSPRPDAEGYRAVADALPWLRQLSHETLRPPPLVSAYVAVPRTGLFVRKDLSEHPLALVDRWTGAATDAMRRFRGSLKGSDPAGVRALCDWLQAERPALLVTARNRRVLWNPAAPGRIGALRSELKSGTAAAIADIAADLRVVHERTQAFRRALRDPGGLPKPQPMEQRGYVYLDEQSGLIAYNLHESDLERLQSPAIPYARAMLGARTIHEWCHLAVDAGWVPLRIGDDDFAGRVSELAAALDALMDTAPARVRALTSGDIRELTAAAVEPDGLIGKTRSLPTTPGMALVRMILRRVPDYQANLLAQRFLTAAERETYVRQNIRHLRAEYTPAQLWRMLGRYLYEVQYLGFSEIADRDEYVVRSTWFDADFIDKGVIDRPGFRALAASVGAICDAFTIDEGAFV
jgi:hypothetical protein